MKRLAVVLSMVSVFLVQDLCAQTYADSVLQFTGAKRVKFVFLRYQWCDANYNPIGPWAADGNTKFAVTTYDTKDNMVRTLNTAVKDANYTWVGARIDRSGTWVVWPDAANSATKIRDFGATAAERTLVSGQTFWTPICFGYEAAANKQYLYFLDSYDPACLSDPGCCYCSKTSKVYKVPFSDADGTVNLAGKTDVGFVAGGNRKDLGISSVSADGKYIACSFPWPNDELFNTTTKTYIDRHDPNEMFGCQPHVAPDNSYRFFHCMGDHEGIYLFPSLSSTADSRIYLYQTTLPGRPAGDTTMADFAEPQWSNHVQFLSNTYPAGLDAWNEDGLPADQYPPSGVNAAWVKTTGQTLIRHKLSCILQKFTPDFKGIAGNIYAAPDIRALDKYLDTWMDNGEIVPGSATDLRSARAWSQRATGIRLAGTGSLVSAVSSNGARVTVCVTDTRGRLIRQEYGLTTAIIDTRDLPSGMYTISTTGRTARIARPLAIAR